MKKILLIATGGTIASVPTKDGLAPGLSADALLEAVPEIRDICEISCVQLLNLDSTNMRPGHWLLIERKIAENYEEYDGFVITHGTDTMAYTAAGLSYLIQNSLKPVVLTGAQIPAEQPGSDGPANLRDAILYATDDESHGVTIVFSGNVIIGTRARKNFSKSFAAFGSINYPIIAKIQSGRIFRYIPQIVKGEVKFYDYLDPSVGLLKLIPGISNKVLEFILDNHDGLVIEGFGVGGVPEYSDYFKQIQEAAENGKVIVMTTQVSNEGSDLSVYRVGVQLKTSGSVLEAYDMTSEAAIAKLMWVLGQTGDFKEARKLFYQPIGCDILMNDEDHND